MYSETIGSNEFAIRNVKIVGTSFNSNSYAFELNIFVLQNIFIYEATISEDSRIFASNMNSFKTLTNQTMPTYYMLENIHID
jgi:hypothetical protein